MGTEQVCTVIIVEAHKSRIPDLQLEWQNVLCCPGGDATMPEKTRNKKKCR